MIIRSRSERARITPPHCLIHPGERLTQCSRDRQWTCPQCRDGCAMCGKGKLLPLRPKREVLMSRTRAAREQPVDDEEDDE